MNTTAAEVRTAEDERLQRVPPVLRALKRYFDLTDQEIADALQMRRTTVRNRITGDFPAFTSGELKAFAYYFGVPPEKMFEDPDDVLLWVITNKKERPEWLLRSRWTSVSAQVAGSRPFRGRLGSHAA